MLAIGLMLFAPLVSRILVAMSIMPTMSMADGMAMQGVAESQAHHASDKSNGAPHDPAPPSTDACGYCSLLFHSPAVAVTIPALPLVLPTTSAPLQGVVFRMSALRRLERRSRGPPLA